MHHFTIFFFLAFIVLIIQGYGQKAAVRNNSFSLTRFQSLRIAHRGGYAYGPENTLRTILHSIQKGVGAVEVDIRLTKDKQLILFHDATVERLLQTDIATPVSELTLAQIQAIPHRDVSQGLQYVASLEDLLVALAKMSTDKPYPVILEFDLKERGANTRPMVDLLMSHVYKQVRRYGAAYFDQFWISTFYPEVLKYLHQKDKRINIGFSVNSHPNTNKFMGRMGVLFAPYLVRKYKVKVIEPNMSLINARFVKKWTRRGIAINAYTANRKCEKAYLEQFPIAYTTNCPFGYCEPEYSDEMGKPRKWCKKCHEKRRESA